jgi:hypothetical protein
VSRSRKPSSWSARSPPPRKISTAGDRKIVSYLSISASAAELARVTSRPTKPAPAARAPAAAPSRAIGSIFHPPPYSETTTTSCVANACEIAIGSPFLSIRGPARRATGFFFAGAGGWATVRFFSSFFVTLFAAGCCFRVPAFSAAFLFLTRVAGSGSGADAASCVPPRTNMPPPMTRATNTPRSAKTFTAGETDRAMNQLSAFAAVA